MASDWQVMTLAEAVQINPQRPLAKGTEAPFVAMEDIIPSQRSVEVRQTRIFEGSGSRFTNGDTLFARITPCLENGKTAFISQLPKETVGHGSTEFIVMSGKENLSDNLFVYYLARDPNFRSYSAQQMEGTSGRQRVPVLALSKLVIELPPLPEQRAIAHILGTLDDKIELNRRMNQTLEAMAQALFKSWFVDFEPFRDQGMQDSPLGEIPMGWEIGTLGQICEVKMGQSPPGDTYNEIGEGIPFYQGIKDFGSRFPHHRVYCTMPTRFAEPYDVLLSVRAPVGRLNVANERCAIGRGLAALCSKVRHHSYLYYLLNNAKNRWETFNSEGTVFGCITRKDIMDVTVIIPPKTIVDRFESLVNTSDNLIALNEQESFTLSTIRDTLLPKLLSGEIRVKDAERFVEKAL